jgi:hypothetical protein
MGVLTLIYLENSKSHIKFVGKLHKENFIRKMKRKNHPNSKVTYILMSMLAHK